MDTVRPVDGPFLERIFTHKNCYDRDMDAVKYKA